MPNTTNPEQEQNSADNKAAKSSMMDDAPLFAGLDDFVLFQPAKKEKPIPAAGRPVAEKKKTAPRRPAEPLPDTKSQPQRTPRAPKSTTSDPNAVLLSVIEICSLLKISRATLVRMDKAGKIPGRIKLGGSVRFHRETIEAWLQSLISSHPTF